MLTGVISPDYQRGSKLLLHDEDKEESFWNPGDFSGMPLNTRMAYGKRSLKITAWSNAIGSAGMQIVSHQARNPYQPRCLLRAKMIKNGSGRKYRRKFKCFKS